MLLLIFYLWIFAILNRARGTRIFNLTGSTELGRIISTLGMAVLVTIISGNIKCLIVCWPGLMLWCSPAWDAYWSAEIGNDASHGRLWGLWHMALRMSLAAPCIIGIAYVTGHPGQALWACATPLLALPYLIFGLISKSTVIPRSEYTVGALLGILLVLTSR